MPDWGARILRTLLQLLAGGAFAALFEQVAHDVPPAYTPYVIIITTLLVTTAQNAIESATGKALLKPASAQHAEVTKVVG